MGHSTIFWECSLYDIHINSGDVLETRNRHSLNYFLTRIFVSQKTGSDQENS